MSEQRNMERTVVITGASRGIGARLAESLHARGFRLGLLARTAPEVAASSTTLARAVDVTDAGALDAFADDVERRFGKIDIWINNAAVLEPMALLADADVDELDRHFRINVFGVALGSRIYAQRARAHGSGVLVNISSGAAIRALPGAASYCASKAAVNMLTETLQLEERDNGLRAFAMSPGVVDTGMQELIRSQSAEQLPWTAAHHEFESEGAFTPIEHLADYILRLAFGPDSPTEVVVAVPRPPLA